MKKYLKLIGIKANKALNKKIDTKTKNKVLNRFANLIRKNKSKIISQNKKDVYFAKKRKLRANLINRLLLNDYKINEIIKSINIIAKLKDPVDVMAIGSHGQTIKHEPRLTIPYTLQIGDPQKISGKNTHIRS